MKVQCSRCQASYNIDPLKVPSSAVKVKCLKCQNTIDICLKPPVENLTSPMKSVYNSKQESGDSGHTIAHKISPEMGYEIANVLEKAVVSETGQVSQVKSTAKYFGKDKAELMVVRPAVKSRQYSFGRKILWLSPIPIVIAICFIFMSHRNNSYILNENSDVILALKKNIQKLRSDIKVLNQKQQFLLAGPKRYEVNQTINAVESLSIDQKEEYDKYNNIISISGHIDSAIISRLHLIKNSTPAPSSYLKTVISNTSTVLSMVREYIQHGEDKRKWSSKAVCLNRLIDRLNPYNYFTDNDIETLEQFFVDAEIIYVSEFQKWERYTKMKDNYQNMKNEQNKIDDQIQAIDEKIAELSNNIREIEHNISIRIGEKKPQTINDYAILYNASSDTSYMSRPPLDGVAKKDEFFFWNGTLAMNEGDIYFVLDAAENPFGAVMTYPFQHSSDEIDIAGFALKNINKKFAELLEGSRVYVVGKYTGNTEVVLVNDERKIIPVLSDCIVADVKYN